MSRTTNRFQARRERYAVYISKSRRLPKGNWCAYTPGDLPQFQRLLGDGSQWGLSLRYAEQPNPDGLAQAYIIGADFIQGEASALILGDNVFYGHGLPDLLALAHTQSAGATVFAYRVNDPERYGIVEFDQSGRALSIEEKPQVPRSNWAVTGLYFCDQRALNIASRLKPSRRGELEIADVLAAYLQKGELEVKRMGRGFAWFDMGTHDSLLEASMFVRRWKNVKECASLAQKKLRTIRVSSRTRSSSASAKNSRKAPTDNICSKSPTKELRRLQGLLLDGEVHPTRIGSIDILCSAIFRPDIRVSRNSFASGLLPSR